MRGTTITIAFGMTILAHACGGGDGGNTDPVTVASAQPGCSSICEQEIRCGSTNTLAECTSECQMGIDGWVREDALEAFADCATNLTCEADSDTCFSMISVLDVHREWSMKCNAQLSACDIDQDICAIQHTSGDEGLILLFAPVVVEEMITCLDGADCAARLTCLQNVFTKYGIDG